MESSAAKSFFTNKFSYLAWTLLLVSAAAAAACFFLIPEFQPVFVFGLPFQLIGKGMAALSLSGAAGNGIAWVCYLLLCAIPTAGYLLMRRKRNPVKVNDSQNDSQNTAGNNIFPSTASHGAAAEHSLAEPDTLLLLLSIYSLILWYFAINPFLFSSMLPEDGIFMVLSLAYWAILGSWALLRLLSGLNRQNQERTPFYTAAARLKLILRLCILLYIVYDGFFCLSDFFRGAAAYLQDGRQADAVILSLDYLTEFALDALAVRILLAAIALLDALARDRYCPQVEQQAALLSRQGKLLVYMAVAVCIGLNLLKLLLSSMLTDLHIYWNIPVIPLILALAAYILADYFKTSRRTHEDQQLFI